MENDVIKSATNYLTALSELFSNIQTTDLQGRILSLDEGASQAIHLLQVAKLNGSKVFVIGNGGSTAIAAHICNDLCKAIGIRGLAFDSQPYLTALANDHGYEAVFERPVALWADAGDLLIAISSSGQSQSILRAVRVAKDKNCKIITLSGFLTGNPLRSIGHINYYVPSHSYGFVELTHAALAHYLTDFVSIHSLLESQKVRNDNLETFTN